MKAYFLIFIGAQMKALRSRADGVSGHRNNVYYIQQQAAGKQTLKRLSVAVCTTNV